MVACRLRLNRVARALAAAMLVSVLTAEVGAASSFEAPDDPLLAQQWNLTQIRAQEAWPRSTGAGAVIAIVDTGVDVTHPDLQDPDPEAPASNRKILPGNTFLGCGPHGCGDGNWRSGPPWESRGHPHGTHVAGIAAAQAGNGIGIAGVAPDARILPVRVLGDDSTGSFRDIAYGIRWAADSGADVINLSLSAGLGGQVFGPAGRDEGLEAAVAYAAESGATVVAAAGNFATPLCDVPADHAEAICVTATDVRGTPAYYANRPLKHSFSYAVAAPGGSALEGCGENVLSTVPLTLGASECGGTGFSEEAGTSMAAPHVAGLAALLVSQGCSAPDVRYAITAVAKVPTAEAEGIWTPVYGKGIIDAKRSVEVGASLPSCRP